MSITWWFDITALLFASFQLESLKRKRTGWAERVRQQSPGWKSCEIFSQLRMLPCFILLFEHGPCKMHEAKFCQSLLNQSLLNEAVSCHNLSQIKNLKSKKSSRKLLNILYCWKEMWGFGHFTRKSRGRKETLNKAASTEWLYRSTCTIPAFYYPRLSFEREFKYFVRRLKDLH